MRTEVLLYDGCDELDVFGPYEVLATVGAAGGDFHVRLVTLDPCERVVAAHGAWIEPHARLSATPDLLIVPGGGWIDGADEGARAQVERGQLPVAVAQRHAAGTTVAAVCTGAMLLAASGLLNGRPAITHHGAVDDLRGAGARVIERARVVDDGDIITGGGVTSGLDVALWIVERRLGRTAADRAAAAIEYQRCDGVWPRDFRAIE